ncbi:hypothetical protein [Streptomyces sp. NBC_00467]|uniref:hypothetical protein n=1 Tax=Streptomyces sp. NBC_00467 TaxID=2975752 RepID=UPI002E17B78B
MTAQAATITPIVLGSVDSAVRRLERMMPPGRHGELDRSWHPEAVERRLARLAVSSTERIAGVFTVGGIRHERSAGRPVSASGLPGGMAHPGRSQ